MRLEEWQKYIETQFFEDGQAEEADANEANEAGPDSPAEEAQAEPPYSAPFAPFEAKSAPNRSVSPAPVPEAEARTATPYAPVTVRPVADPASHEAKPLITPPPAAEIPVMTLPLTEEEPVIPLTEPEPIAAQSAETLRPDYRQKLDFDTEIPDFANYMSSRRSDNSDRVMETKLEAAKEVPEAESVGSSYATLANRTLSETETETNHAEAQNAPVRSARPVRTRARHARNVRPENVPSGLSAAEMWVDVPRHVQTLLALERIEEKEIAQSSYKRPFAEGRLELIERLLDPILSLEDTARLLNVCPTTVRRYTNRGILTHYRKEPERSGDPLRPTERETRQRRFRLSDILAFLETQQAALNSDRQTEPRTARASARNAVNAPLAP